MNRFNSEKALSETAIENGLIDKISEMFYEFNYQEREPFEIFGIPDYIAASVPENECQPIFLVAIEFKLRNWRRALEQGFKYRSFADIVYVVLDEANSSSALRHIDMFTRSNIGLITLNCFKQVKVHHTPVPEQPYQDHLMTKSHQIVRQHFSTS